MSDPIVNTLSKALHDAQRVIESERARNEQLVARLHEAGKREARYQELLQEQLELIALLEGHHVQGVRDVA